MMRCLGFIFVVFAALSFVSAEGLSPARYEVNFNSGEKMAFPFQLVGGPEETYSISVVGDLAKYTQLSDSRAIGGQTVFLYLNFPKDIDVPGPHRLSFVASKDLKSNGLGITGEARGLVIVHVPYPGQYLESHLTATNANKGEPVSLSLSVVNRGRESISNALAYIDIFGPDGNKAHTENLGAFSILSEEAKTIDYSFDTSVYTSGTYRAVSRISYSDKISSDETSFKVGSLNVEIVNYTREVERDKINRFEIQVESGWNNKIGNVFAQGSIPGTSISFTTPTIGLDPFQQSTLVGFFDTTGIKNDPFQIKLVLSYENKASEKTIEVRFKKETNYVVIALIAAGILVLIVVFFVIRKFLIKSRSAKK